MRKATLGSRRVMIEFKPWVPAWLKMFDPATPTAAAPSRTDEWPSSPRWGPWPLNHAVAYRHDICERTPDVYPDHGIAESLRRSQPRPCRSRRPGVAPVHFPSAKVSSPLTMIERYPFARWMRRHSSPGRSYATSPPSRIDVQLLHVVDDDIGACTLAEHATVLEACGIRREGQCGSAPPRASPCLARTSHRRMSVGHAPPVKNFVWAPPSDTPGRQYGLSIISVMKSALSLCPAEELHVEVAGQHRSNITSMTCLLSSSAIWPTDLPTYF